MIAAGEEWLHSVEQAPQNWAASRSRVALSSLRIAEQGEQITLGEFVISNPRPRLECRIDRIDDRQCLGTRPLLDGVVISRLALVICLIERE